MKKISGLKLPQLSKVELMNRHLNALKGGNCYCSCSGCQCSSWDGTGTIPPGQSSNDMGLGYMNAAVPGNLNSYFG